MTRGRKPTPTAQKELHGNPGKRPLPQNEPKPPTEGIRVPSWLSESARKHWYRLLPIVRDMRVMTVADVDVLALLCVAWDDFVRAQKVIEDDGPTYSTITESGSVIWRKRPEVDIASAAWSRVLRGLTEFGLTPSSRGRVDVPKSNTPVDELAAWRSRSANVS